MMNRLLVIIFSLCLGMTQLQAKSEVMSLKQTTEIKAVTTTLISPDARHIAYTLNVPRESYVDEDGKPYSELWLTNFAANNRKFVTGKVKVSEVAWSADAQAIYYLAKRNDDKFTSIYRIAVDGGESEKIVSIKADIEHFSINAKHSQLVFLAKPAQDEAKEKLKEKGFRAKVYEESEEKQSAYLVDLKQLDQKPKKLAIEQHILSVMFHPTIDQLLMRVSPTSLIDDEYMQSQYQIYSLKGELIQKFESQGKLGMARWSKDGKYIAMIGAQDIHDPAVGRLVIAETRSGKITQPLTDYPAHLKDIRWIDQEQLLFLAHKGTQSEVVLFDINKGTISQKVADANRIMTQIDLDAAGKELVATASSDQHPSEVFHLSNDQLVKLTNSNPWLDEIKMPVQQSITYKARDGVELQGVLIYPIGYKKNKKYPLIMMVHGGPESHVSNGWLDKYSYPIKHAAGNGFAVFLPNYRGSTGRGVEFSKMGQADYAGAEFNDLLDAISHLSDMGLVDKNRVGITGGSYGGYASAWAATALSEHFAASVMFVGISNQLSKFGTTDIPKEMFNVHARNYPWDKWQWMLERSPIYHTDKAKTPILILHGEKDTRVHPSQSMELYRYIKTRTNTPARLVFYPEEKHGNKKSAAQLDYAMRLMRWMAFYLKGKGKGSEMPPYEIEHPTPIKNK